MRIKKRTVRKYSWLLHEEYSRHILFVFIVYWFNGYYTNLLPNPLLAVITCSYNPPPPPHTWNSETETSYRFHVGLKIVKIINPNYTHVSPLLHPSTQPFAAVYIFRFDINFTDIKSIFFLHNLWTKLHLIPPTLTPSPLRSFTSFLSFSFFFIFQSFSFF